MPARFLLVMLFAALALAASAETRRWQSTYGGPKHFASLVATNAAQWDALWKRLAQRPPVTFDARRQTGIGIFLGERNTGGYAIRIVSMAAREERFVVACEEQKPAPGAAVTTAFTAPWLVLLIEKPALPVVVECR